MSHGAIHANIKDRKGAGVRQDTVPEHPGRWHRILRDEQVILNVYVGRNGLRRDCSSESMQSIVDVCLSGRVVVVQDVLDGIDVGGTSNTPDGQTTTDLFDVSWRQVNLRGS